MDGLQPKTQHQFNRNVFIMDKSAALICEFHFRQVGDNHFQCITENEWEQIQLKVRCLLMFFFKDWVVMTTYLLYSFIPNSICLFTLTFTCQAIHSVNWFLIHPFNNIFPVFFSTCITLELILVHCKLCSKLCFLKNSEKVVPEKV